MIRKVSRRQLLVKLRRVGLVSEHAEAEALRLFAMPGEGVDMPWFVRALQGIGAWVSAFLVLFATLVVFGREMGLLGLPLCWAGLVLERKAVDSPFLSQLSISFILLGAGLAVFGLGSLSEELFSNEGKTQQRVWLLFSLLVCGAMGRFTTGSVTRGAMTASILVSVVLLVSLSFAEQGLPYVFSAFVVLYSAVAVWLVLYEVKARATLGSRFETVLWSLIAVLMLGLGSEVSVRSLSSDQLMHLWILSLGLTLLVAWTLSVVLSDLGHAITSRQGLSVLGLGALISLSLFAAPAAIFSMLLLLLAVRAGYRVLLGVGVASLLVSMSHFYYLLQFSLLLKSMTLIIAGAIMLVAASRLSKLSGS